MSNQNNYQLSEHLAVVVAVHFLTHFPFRKLKLLSNFCVEEDRDNMDARIVSVGQEWAEASSLHEIAEAVHNWAAVRFQCAPWNWSGLMLLRILHEASYFSTSAEGEGPHGEVY